jgi:hypothetical protein
MYPMGCIIEQEIHNIKTCTDWGVGLDCLMWLVGGQHP